MKTELITKGYEGRNEDYCKVVELDGQTLAVMADGMGGLSLGEEAAECVCESIAEYVVANMGSICLWQDAFTYADNKLRELSIAKRSNMGAAVTALIVSDSTFEVAWQGNVRLYVRKKGVDEQVTTDHVMDSGFGRKMLTRCLKGAGLRGDIAVMKESLQDVDLLYLCTDGYYDKDSCDDLTCLNMFL